MRCRYPQALRRRRHSAMCPRSQPVRLNRISSRPVRAVAAAQRGRVRAVPRVRVPVVLRVRVRVVLLAQRAHRPVARRTFPAAVAPDVAAVAAFPAAAGVPVR